MKTLTKRPLDFMKPATKLKIGFVFDDSLDSSDGVANQVKTLGSWLSQQGHQVRYLVGQTKLQEWEGGRVYSLARNQRVTFNGNRVSIPFPANRRRIKEVLASENFDVLHVQMPYSPFMAQRVIRAAASNVAVVGTFHILPAGRLASLGSHGLRLTYGRNLRRFFKIVSVSSPAADFAKRAFGISSSILPNVINLKKFSPASKKGQQTGDHIVFLGRLVDRKGCQYLIETFALLHKKRPSTVLTIGGDGPERAKLESLAVRKGLKLGQSINFLGFVNEADKPALLAGADIACFPSLYGESFGIVLLEAMAAGSGVVLAGDNPGYRSVLGARPELLIDPRDTLNFAAQLDKLLSNKSAGEELHRWQTNEVKRYSVDEVGPELVSLYHQAIASVGKKRHN